MRRKQKLKLLIETFPTLTNFKSNVSFITNRLDNQVLFAVPNERITRITLSHNKLTAVPPNISDLPNLEYLNLWNNQIEELPASISSLPNLKILNVGMNRLSKLPRGFGSFPKLEILDLTYNNLREQSLPGNFFFIGRDFNFIIFNIQPFSYPEGSVSR